MIPEACGEGEPLARDSSEATGCFGEQLDLALGHRIADELSVAQRVRERFEVGDKGPHRGQPGVVLARSPSGVRRRATVATPTSLAVRGSAECLTELAVGGTTGRRHD